jgi:endonuclease YncB( thermonuclease family)
LYKYFIWSLAGFFLCQFLAEDPAWSRGKLSGKVIRVLDGESFAIQGEKRLINFVRIGGVDAPARAQPHSLESKKGLRQLLHAKVVQVEWYKMEPACVREKVPVGRCPTVGKVLLDREDVALKLLKEGLAWHDKPYLDEQNTVDRTLYAEAEEEARVKKLGIWKKGTPIPPWLYRLESRTILSKDKKK